MSTVSPWPLLARLARPHRKATLGFAAALTASTAVALAGPVLLGLFVDRLKSGKGVSELLPIGIAYVVGGLAATGINVLVTWRSTTLAWKITNTLRTDLTRRVLHADRAFLRDHPTGELVSRIDGDVSALTDMLAMFVARVLSVVFVALGGVIVLVILAQFWPPCSSSTCSYWRGSCGLTAWLCWPKPKRRVTPKANSSVWWRNG